MLPNISIYMQFSPWVFILCFKAMEVFPFAWDLVVMHFMKI